MHSFIKLSQLKSKWLISLLALRLKYSHTSASLAKKVDWTQYGSALVSCAEKIIKNYTLVARFKNDECISRRCFFQTIKAPCSSPMPRVHVSFQNQHILIRF